MPDLKLRCCYFIWTGFIHGKKLDYFQGRSYFLLKYILRNSSRESNVGFSKVYSSECGKMLIIVL